MKYSKVSASIVAFLAVLCLGPVQTPGAKPAASSTLKVKAKFGNQPLPQGPVGGLLPDGKFLPCGFDYVDKTDTCTGMVSNGNVFPNAEQADLSFETTGGLFSGQYLLRTVPIATTTMTNPPNTTWDYYVLNPSRWVVLDFSNPDLQSTPPTTTSNCQDIDQKVANAALAITNGTSGFKVTAPTPNNNLCVDNLVVRFEAYNAFTSGAATSSLTVYIDEPQLIKSGKTGGRVQWNEIYSLVFEQPLSITPLFDGKGSISLDTLTSDLADLKDVNGTPVGTWHMPISVTLTPQ